MHFKKISVFIIIILITVGYIFYNMIGKPISLRRHKTYLTVNLKIKPNISENEYINIVSAKPFVHNFVIAYLKSAGKERLMYVHYRGDYISDAILANKIFEPHLVVQFESFIKSHPGIQVLDVGCNLGIYTLTAAALGCTVVAVDANPNNTARLVQSLLANGLSNRSTVCLNAMSNIRKEFIIGLVPSNIGGSHVVEVVNNSNSVKTIFMDDLIPFFDKSREVAIKIDIETKEIDALKQASKFFDQRNVSYVMMEWQFIKSMPDIKYVLDFFTNRGFKCYANINKQQQLLLPNYISWPWDVFWLK